MLAKQLKDMINHAIRREQEGFNFDTITMYESGVDSFEDASRVIKLSLHHLTNSLESHNNMVRILAIKY